MNVREIARCAEVTGATTMLFRIHWVRHAARGHHQSDTAVS